MYVMLIDGLPTDSLVPVLVTKQVVGQLQKERMGQLTRTQKTAYLLNEIVIRSLKAGVLKVFELLLQAMDESEDLTCQSLATDLSTKLGKVEISLPNITPPSGNCCYTVCM